MGQSVSLGETFEDIWEDQDPSDAGELRPSEDDTEDRYDPSLNAARAVDELVLSEDTALFTGTKLVELITSISQLRQLYGPTDPAIADLCEEIHSGLAEVILSIRENPLDFIIEVVINDATTMHRLKKFLNDWEAKQSGPSHKE